MFPKAPEMPMFPKAPETPVFPKALEMPMLPKEQSAVLEGRKEVLREKEERVSLERRLGGAKAVGGKESAGSASREPRRA